MKHGGMEDAFMNFVLATAAHDAAFTEQPMTNVNLSMKLRHQRDQIRALQSGICNLKLVSATRTTKVKGNNKGGPTYARDKKQKLQCPTDPTGKKYNNKDYCWLHGYYTSDPHTPETLSITMFGHNKDATQCKPMGVSKNNRARIWNKV